MEQVNSFVAALSRYDMARLKTAFEAAKRATGERYDRTTLNRWMGGSVPTKEAFVRQFADELGDESIFTSWRSIRESQSPSQGRSVVTRYERLSDEEKDWVFHEIRARYLGTFPSVRSRATWRIEVNDPPDPADTDHLMVRLELTWNGDIPADAEAVLVTEHEQLGDAYANPDCIFREILDLEPGRLAKLLTSGPDPILAITPLDTAIPRGSHHTAEQVEPGLFRFDNAEAADAQVRLSISYPYPRGLGVFFVKLGRYQVPDAVEATLRLNSRSASNPRAFPYMPPGRQREFSQNMFGPDELFFTFGTGNTVYGEGDGLVLYWTETQPLP